MARYPLFIAKRGEFWEDGWTYGDWRQYLCSRPGGTQCARVSGLPYWLALFGLILLTLAAMPLALVWAGADHSAFAWDRVWVFVVIGVGLMLPMIALRLSRRCLMKAVGPMNDGDRRVLPGEEKRRG